ncbi:PKS-NRPS hybrid synthetase cheA [Linum perenne]
MGAAAAKLWTDSDGEAMGHGCGELMGRQRRRSYGAAAAATRQGTKVIEMNPANPPNDVEEVENHNDDYSHLFTTAEIFESHDNAFGWANAIALEKAFNLVKASKKILMGTDLAYFYVTCDRVRKYRDSKADQGAEKRKHTATKKCECPFMLKINEEMRGNYLLTVIRGTHNHQPMIYHDGHKRRAAIDDDQLKYIRVQYSSQVKPSKIRHGMHVRNPEKPQPAIKHIYNATCKLRSLERGGRNHTQHMLALATQYQYVVFFYQSVESASVTHVFMAHPEAVKLHRAYPYVVLLDSTYKTNRYGYPLVELIGITPVGKSFTIAYVIMKDESIDIYKWVLEKLKMLVEEDSVPNVIVTDPELGLLAAIKETFPHSVHLLCIWHISADVETRAKNMVKDGQLGKNIKNRWWKDVLEASTDVEFHSGWEDFQKTWSGHGAPLEVNYVGYAGDFE